MHATPAIRPLTLPTEDYANATDDQLHEAYRAGDQDAFAELYNRYRGPVFRFLRNQLSADQCDDVYQETWRKMIDNVDRYRPKAKFASYLFTIAHNALMDWHRANKRFDESEPQELEAAEQPERDTARDQMLDRLRAQIRALPLAQRTAWLLQQESGFSLAEIANVCGTSVEGIKSRLRYANDKLKSGMMHNGE